MNDQIIVGLDIGSTKVCAVVGRMDNDGLLEILGMGKSVSEGVKKGVIENIDQTVIAIKEAISEAEKQSQIDIKVVNTGVSGNHIQTQREFGVITRNLNDNEISIEDINRLSKDMYRLVTPPGSEIIHVIPQEYTIDYQAHIKEPVGRIGVKLGADFNIITAQSNAINNIKKCMSKSNLHDDNMVLVSIASSLSVLSREEKDAGVAVIDIGGDTTDIAIIHENIIRYTASIPFGGNIITNDIKKGCMIMPAQAELLKIKHGKAISSEANLMDVVVIPGLRDRSAKEISVKNLAHIIEARMEEIIEMIYAKLSESGLDKALAGGLVLTGGGANLSFIKELFEWVTGINTRIGNPNEYMGKNVTGIIKQPEFATAVGLVLAGFRALDERENRYLQMKNQTPSHNNIRTKTEPVDPRKSDSFKPGFLGNLFGKAKNLLMDDFDNQGEY